MRKVCLLWIHIFLLPYTAIHAGAQTQTLKLWYGEPARKWTDALPIGNGRLGAMIYGGVDTDHIQFNEQTLWTGGPRDYQREGAYKYLQPIRHLLADGKQVEAQALAEEHFMGRKNGEETYDSVKAVWMKKAAFGKRTPLPFFLFENGTPVMQQPAGQGWESVGFDGLDGAVWLGNTFNLPEAWKGKDLILDLGKVRDGDITFVNGAEIGRTEGVNANRYYRIPDTLLHPGENRIAIQVINFFDKGGLTGGKDKRQSVLLYPAGDTSHALTLNPSWKYWVQDDSPPESPRYQADYQPFGDVYLQFQKGAPVTDYYRELDISNAVSTVAYTQGGVHYRREYFASAEKKAVVVHLQADKSGAINLDAVFGTLHRQHIIRMVDENTISLSVQVQHGALKGLAYLHVETNGRLYIHSNPKPQEKRFPFPPNPLDHSGYPGNPRREDYQFNPGSFSDPVMTISGASEVTLYLSASTNFKSYKDVSGDIYLTQALQKLSSGTYSALKAIHAASYKKLFSNFSIDLGAGTHTDLPTDERIRQFTPESDPALLALYLQYGRYLMISSSRPGAWQPANLQGLWNNQLTPPWGSKFTTNINLEMNYWPAETLNLSACTPPLFKLIDEVAEAGSKMARAHYGAPGWVLHHNTDIWRGTAPINASNHGIWVTGAPWLCHHIWEHYLFTGDKEFLKQHYGEMKGAADFFTAFLIKDSATGWLISTPSNSPEHGGLVAGPTMDHQIIRDLYKNCIAASEALGVDENLRAVWHAQYALIAPNKIGKYGQLQEWLQDKDDPKDDHRHVSHLWGVFPGTDITWGDSSLMKAARQSLLYRGDGGNGWSLAWKLNLWARFRDGNHALKILQNLLTVADYAENHERGGVYKNLFDAHPPFQIDGNFGGASGIGEMLLQSQNGYLDLLPALPDALPDGDINGICARGGFLVHMQWKSGKLAEVEVTSQAGNDCLLKYGKLEKHFPTQKGKTYRFDGMLNGI